MSFWVTPGGEIEAGEEPEAAAVRELREELGLEMQVTGPLYTEANAFELAGEMRDNVGPLVRGAVRGGCSGDARGDGGGDGDDAGDAVVDGGGG